jgi:hypothetical protein
LVEGFFDQLAAEALGIRAIAAGSAGFSNQQLADLLDMAAKGATFVIARDKDPRGIERAQTMLERLYPHARLMPDLPGEGIKDVADFYREHGEAAAEQIRDLMAEAQDAVELALVELGKIKRPADKVKFLKHVIVPCLLRIPDRSERGAVAKWIAKADGLNTEIVRDAIREVEGRLIVETPEEEEDMPEEEWAHLLEPGVLDRYVADACKIKRVVGETDKEVVKLLTCDAAEAQLEPLPTGKPIGGPVMLTGESGRGKNFLADAAVSGLPEEWYLSFTAASATSFYYAAEIDPAFLKHRFVYPNEVEAIDAVIEFLRPMISQAKAKKYVTNKNSDGAFTFQEIDVEGPITGCIPTVRNKLDDQLQTRLLVVEIEDYDGRIGDHTKALSEQYSPDFVADPHGHLVPKWRAALRSLTGVRKVVIPFAGEKGFKFNNEEVKHGARLWGNLLGLMCAHAWLEQRNREILDINGTKAVVATAEDYKVAYDLLQSVGARSIVNIGEIHRKIVRAVYDLKEAEDTDDARKFGSLGFGVREIAKKAGISPGTVSKNRAFLTKSVGLLYEPEDGGGRLQVSPDVYPESLENEAESGMTGFPEPAEVAKWDTHAPGGGNTGNTETPRQKPDTYAEKAFPVEGNTQETPETPNDAPRGDAEGPNSSGLTDEETATRLVREGMGEDFAHDAAKAKLEALERAYWAAADDGLGEDMFFRWCVSEGRTEDLVRLHIIDEVEAPTLYDAHPDRYEELADGQKAALSAWIGKAFKPSDTELGQSSYNLKHEFERSHAGFYVTDGQFKGAMLAAGYEPHDADPYPWSWYFEIGRTHEEREGVYYPYEVEQAAEAEIDDEVVSLPMKLAEERVVFDPKTRRAGIPNPETGELEDPPAVVEVELDEAGWADWAWFSCSINGAAFGRSLSRLKERGIVATNDGRVWTLDQDAQHRAWLEQFERGAGAA